MEKEYSREYWDNINETVHKLAVNDVKVNRVLKVLTSTSDTDLDTAVRVLVLFAGSPTAKEVIDIVQKVAESDHDSTS